jgi:predicted flap endonuclease-1-like 5' DNA nuclease
VPSAPAPTLGTASSLPPPPPLRQPSPYPAAAANPAGTTSAPRAPATPPPPPPRPSSAVGLSRPLTTPPSVSATAQLEQRLGTTQIELRKLASERHTLRARLRRDADRRSELESALGAEKELRRQASDEHHAALAGLRTRITEIEAAKDAEIARLNGELQRARAEAERAVAEAQAARDAAAAAVNVAAVSGRTSAKTPQGLRRIRGIGPAYQRVLEQLGVTRVQQVAAWQAHDVAAFAEKLKMRADRIIKDDWVGQAKLLEPDPE